MGGLAVGLWLMLAQPSSLEGVPLGGGRRGASPVVEAGDRLRVLGARSLLGGTDIHPHDGGT